MSSRSSSDRTGRCASWSLRGCSVNRALKSSRNSGAKALAAPIVEISRSRSSVTGHFPTSFPGDVRLHRTGLLRGGDPGCGSKQTGSCGGARRSGRRPSIGIDRAVSRRPRCQDVRRRPLRASGRAGRCSTFPSAPSCRSSGSRAARWVASGRSAGPAPSCATPRSHRHGRRCSRRSFRWRAP